MDMAAHSPFSLLPFRGSRRTGAASPAGTADLPSAVPAWGRSSVSRPGACGLEPSGTPAADLKTNPGTRGVSPADVLTSLRAAIAGIERPSLPPPGEASSSSPQIRWDLGCAQARKLLPQGLETEGLHEIKPVFGQQGAGAAAWTASLGFALRLAALRLHGVQDRHQPTHLLWCWPQRFAREFGHLSGWGLQQLGIDPARVILVESAREAETLLAVEEGLKAGAFALVLGVVEGASLNAARRLSLAAQEGRTPALLATHPAREGAAGCATRWRIARVPSGPHPFDPRAPGLPRFSVGLERCRSRPQGVGLSPLVLEWCDETFRFRMAAQLAADAVRPLSARQSARV